MTVVRRMMVARRRRRMVVMVIMVRTMTMVVMMKVRMIMVIIMVRMTVSGRYAHLLCARQCLKHFTCLMHLLFPTTLKSLHQYYPHFDRGEN